MTDVEPNRRLQRVQGMYLSAPLSGTRGVTRRPPPPTPPPQLDHAEPTGPESDQPTPDQPELDQPELEQPEPDEAYVSAGAVPAGFDAFYRLRRPTIVAALALALGDADVAADAADEAMTRAYERWSTVGQLDRPEGWVYRVAFNWAMSIFRRRRLSLHRMYEPSVVDLAMTVDPNIHRAVAALDIKQRSVVVCRHLLGWSVAETAEALGISEGTVKSRLHRATTTLRTQLRDLQTPEEQS